MKNRERILAKLHSLRQCKDWREKVNQRKRDHYVRNKDRILKKIKSRQKSRSREKVESDRLKFRQYARDNKVKLRQKYEERREHHLQKKREYYHRTKMNGGECKGCH